MKPRDPDAVWSGATFANACSSLTSCGRHDAMLGQSRFFCLGFRKHPMRPSVYSDSACQIESAGDVTYKALEVLERHHVTGLDIRTD
jgi:hypothetical protein